jgi:rubrerythrin
MPENMRERLLTLTEQRNNNKLIRKLLTVQELIDDVLVDLMPKNDEFECNHPEEARKDMSVMGCEHWICRKCGFEYTEESDG